MRNKKQKKTDAHTSTEIDETPQKDNEKPANIRIGFWFASSSSRALADSLLSPFIPLYGRTLPNSTSAKIGFIVSVTSLLSIIQIFWAYLAHKFNISRIIAIISSYLSSIFSFVLLPIKNILTFGAVRGVNSIVLSATLPTSSNIFAERTSPRSWPLRNSLLQGFLVGGTLIGTLIGGVILWKVPTDLGFPIIFISGGVITIISAIFFQIAIPSYKRLKSRGRWHHIEEVDLTLANTLATMKTDKNFMLFCLVNFIFVFGVNLSGPFYIIFNTDHYDLTIFKAALLTSIGLVPQMISSMVTAKLIEKVRKKELLIIAGIFASFFPVFFMIPSLAGRVTNVFWILIIIWCTNGIAWGIINSSFNTLLLDIIHPRRRTLQLAINNSITAIALFIAPILGGFIIDNTASIYILLIISASLRFAGAVLFSIVKEPIIGGTILRPIQRVIPFLIRSNAEKGITLITGNKPPRRRKPNE